MGIDALFCADREDLVLEVMQSAQRSLKVGKAFLFFSFSKPEYLLKYTTTYTLDDTATIPSTKKSHGNSNSRIINGATSPWKSVDVWELDDIYIYRFVKNEALPSATTNDQNPSLQLKKKIRVAAKRKNKQ